MRRTIKRSLCRSIKRLGTRHRCAILFLVITAMISFIFVTLIIRLLASADEHVFNSPWSYYCDAGECRKIEITDRIKVPVSQSVCQLFCAESGGLWPKPTGHMSIGNFANRLNPNLISFEGIDVRSTVGQLIQENVEIFKENTRNLAGKRPLRSDGYGLVINIKGNFDAEKAKLTLSTPENYTLRVYEESDQLVAEITGASYFGVRHGLETLSQLIVYDELYEELKIARDVFVKDGPAFPYRGILLDTSRNFIDKESILRTIKAMGMSKLNTFHWHITDSHSFPYVSKTWPKFSKYGAYAPDKVYTQKDISEIVKYGLLMGVRVLPEFDAPAHVGEGWQWVGHNSTVCFKAEPWQQYCVEPPCGQLNPTSEKVYEILEGIYSDMIQDFEPDIFHMGGDEVNIKCWNSSYVIKEWMMEKGWNFSSSSFHRLWDYFQSKAYDKLTKANNGKEIPAILWTSGLTDEDNLKLLDPKKYIIQIWTTGYDPTVGRLLRNKFRLIFSNYDSMYLDCGFGAWVGEGNNWCSPYKGWQKQYDNSPMRILERHGFGEETRHLALGGEATLWSEQVDSTSVDSRLWPRSAAMAERLWSDPRSIWIHAEHRMLRHRERLVQRGIMADSLEPEWCLQNQGHCYLNQ